MPKTTTTPAALEGMVGVGGNAKGVQPLGYITWYSVPQGDVPIAKLRKAWMLAGLDPRPLPKDQRAADIFRRAMRAQEKRHKNEDGTITQTDVKDAVDSAEEIVYQVSRVVRDAEGKVVDYPKALQAIFNKEELDIYFKPLGGVSRSDVIPMMEEINEYYEKNAKTVNGFKVRKIVRDFLRSDDVEQEGQVGLSGENLRGKAGGVYFVLAKYVDQLEGLSQALSELYPDGAAFLYSVPLADGSTARELIRRHHIANTMDEAKATIAKVGELLRDSRKRSVRTDVAEHHWNALQGMKRRVAAYKRVLHDEDDEVDETLALLERQINSIPLA